MKKRFALSNDFSLLARTTGLGKHTPRERETDRRHPERFP